MTRIEEVMTPDPRTLDASDTVAAAAKVMADDDIGDVLVVDADRLYGIITDRDITVRVVAEGRDPQSTTLRDACSTGVVTLTPDDSVDDAERVMGEQAVRRLPIVQDGRPVGVVSLGDLAIEEDPESALADISAAPADE
ncbi:MAG TPA: CBS domain-containing protein [Frankiaceae bacterium]|nr:CBS domain-containing protein [Frankiaceae bacterium]